MGRRSVGVDKNTVVAVAVAEVEVEANSSFPGRAGLDPDCDYTSPWVLGVTKPLVRNW